MTYRLNPLTGAIEPVYSKEEIIARLVRDGKDFDNKLLAWYGEQQDKFMR